MNPHKTPIGKKELITLCERHVSVKEMAEQFNCSTTTIRNRLREWKISYVSPREHYKSRLYEFSRLGYTATEMANALQVPRSRLLNNLQAWGIERKKEKPGKKKGISQASMEFSRQLFERHRAGMSLGKLAAEYGVTKQCVHQRIERYKEISNRP